MIISTIFKHFPSQLDNVTADVSTAPFGEEISRKYAEILDALPEKPTELSDQSDGQQTSLGYRNFVISRLLCTSGEQFFMAAKFLLDSMTLKVKSRLVDFYGQPWARLTRDASIDPIPEEKPGRLHNIIMGFLNLFLLGLHQQYFQHLEGMCVDQLVRADQWQNLINSLMSDWRDSNILVICFSAVYSET